MDMKVKDEFIRLWRKNFNNAELPITFYYTSSAEHAQFVKPGSLARCIIGALAEVRKGRSFTFNIDSIGCSGGKKYLGFTGDIMQDFEYFLSCGITGELEGERYKKTPELVKETMKDWPAFKAPAPFVVFKRWDNLKEEDTPEVVIFFAQSDVLSGLFTLANFDRPEAEAVFTPMGSGCSSIVTYPYVEKDAASPRAVIGMFDPSARPYVHTSVLSFSVPMNRFVEMIGNMEESFLITDTWRVIQRRID